MNHTPVRLLHTSSKVCMRNDPDHATRARYERGCRCAKCKRANADYQRSYRDRTRPTIRHYGGITWEEHQLWN